MQLIALSFLAGCVLVQNLASLPAAQYTLFGVALIPALLLLPAYRALWVFAAAVCWTLWMAHVYLADFPPPSLESKPLVVRGVIADIPQINEDRRRFLFDITHLSELDPQSSEVSSATIKNILPMRVGLNWYHTDAQLQVGDVWQLAIKIKRNHGFANPGGSDYEGWLFRQGIAATGYVLTNSDKIEINRIQGTSSSPWLSLQKVRETLLHELNHRLRDSPHAGLLVALAIGDKRGISDAQWQVLTATGTNHLMAISGLHIGLIAGLVFFLTKRAWRYNGRLLQLASAPQAAAVGGVIAAGIYAALAGFSIPTQRALIMIVVAMLALARQRSVQPSTMLSWALLLVLLWDPFAVMDAGFWLSFMAVAVIFFAMGGRLAQQGLWWRWGRVQWVIAIGLTPLLLMHFNNVPLISPLTNLIAVPVMGLLIVPVNLLGTLLVMLVAPLGEALLQIASFSLSMLWPLLSVPASVEWLSWRAEPVSLWAWGIAVAGIVWLLVPRGVPARWLGVFGMVPLVSTATTVPSLGAFDVTVLDVGQGFAAVVQTRQHVLIYDTGPAWNTQFDTGHAVVLPFLRHRGIHAVNNLVLSHDDIDHVGGAESVLKHMPVKRLIASFEPGPEVRVTVDDMALCTRGMQWDWDGVHFEILHPSDNSTYIKDNDKSCVLKISNARHSVLLTGDIEKRVERELLNNYNVMSQDVMRGQSNLKSDVLVVPHHGSNTSSSGEFIDAVQPQWAIFTAGYRNRWGFPRPEVVSRYAQRDIQVLDTISAGAISISAQPDKALQVAGYRDSVKRYWHWRQEVAPVDSVLH